MTRLHVLFWPAIALFTNLAHAEDRPTLGLLYNVKETGSLNYDCRLEGDTLACEFTQISVRLKSTPAQRASELDKARKNSPQLQREFDKKECAQIEGLASAIQGGEPPPGVDVKQFKKA